MEHEKQIEALIEAGKYIKHTPDQQLILDLYAENKRLREAIAEVLSWNGGAESVGWDMQERLEQALKGTAE